MGSICYGLHACHGQKVTPSANIIPESQSVWRTVFRCTPVYETLQAAFFWNTSNDRATKIISKNAMYGYSVFAHTYRLSRKNATVLEPLMHEPNRTEARTFQSRASNSNSHSSAWLFDLRELACKVRSRQSSRSTAW